MKSVSPSIDGNLNSLVDALKNLLGKWADKEGVTVKYHKTEPRLLFHFRTPDNFGIKIDYDINQTSREYVDNLILGIRQDLLVKRRERHENPIVIH